MAALAETSAGHLGPSALSPMGTTVDRLTQEASALANKVAIDRFFRRLALASALVVASVGAMVMVGWWLNISVLKSIRPDFVSMKFNTALGFLLAGTSLYLLLQRPPDFRHQLERACAWTVTLVGIVSLAQWIFLVDFGVDEIFVRDNVSAMFDHFPGRMSPATALSFVLIGLHLLLRKARSNHFADFIPALLVFAIGYFGILSHALESEAILRGPIYGTMAVSTWVAVAAMGLAMLLSAPDYPGISLIHSDSLTGHLLRRFIPVVIILPPVASAICLHLAQLGFFDESTAFSFIVFFLVGAISGLMLFTGKTIQRVESKRQKLALEREGLLEDLHSSQEFSRLVVEHSQDSLTIWDHTGRLLSANPAARLAFAQANYPNLEGLRWHDLAWDEPTRDRALQAFEAAANGQRGRFEVEDKISQRSWDILLSPLIKPNGSPTQVHMAARDTTLQRKSDKNAVAKLAALATNAAKMDFLAHVSHEIRSPLGVMIGYAEMLRDHALSDADRRQFVETIYRNGHSALAIVNDLLDMSKAQANKLQLAPVEIDLFGFLGEIVDSMQIKAAEKGLSLKLHIAEEVPRGIRADALRLRQILVNLLANAIKFTDKGGVVLAVATQIQESSEKSQSVCLEFSITDTGCGISAPHQAVLFAPFTQADPGIARRFGGTGLGLCLSRDLAKAMGGDVFLKWSEIDHGSTFVATVLCEIGDIASTSGTVETFKKEPEPYNLNPKLQGKSVLLVEDCPDSRLVTKTILEVAGAHVDTATNGEEGVTKAKAGHYSAILMDIQMPVLDGRAATMALRQSGYRGPIVALTAHALPEERERSKAIGFTAFISKPFGREELIEKLVTLEKVGDTTTGVPPAGVHGDWETPAKTVKSLISMVKKLSVCIVDDEPELLKLYEMQFSDLAKKGRYVFSYLTSADGCLAALNSELKVDVAILDLNMPGMSGFELLEIMRQRFPTIRRMVCSAYNDATNIKRATAAGAQKYLCKPLRLEDLERELEEKPQTMLDVPPNDSRKVGAEFG